jgi:ribonucleoside-diphosphate reductase alpha chain
METNEYIWLNDFSQQFLEKDYLLPGQTVDERVKIIAHRAGKLLKDNTFADKFVGYFKKGWFSLSTPVWTNFGTDRGLPISCFGSYIDDSLDSILETLAEVGKMTKFGGGTSAYFGNLRPRGSQIKDNGTSSGAVHFMQLFESMMTVVSQGSTRRGSFAAYLPIDHLDIEEFLAIKHEGHPLQVISSGVTVPDSFMKGMIAGDDHKRHVWAKVLKARTDTGYPYILFSDNANKHMPEVYKKGRPDNYEIVASNLCSEIMLPSNKYESFVCCLSSMNILHYDEWKTTDAVETMIYFLDTVMTEFIQKAKKLTYLDRAVQFAERHRALGLGWLGWHSYLQKNMIPFESMEAKYKNLEIAKHIEKKAIKASKELAIEFGEPELMTGAGLRNSTLCAIAPTKSSAFILGQVSEGVEPNRSNYDIKDLAKGKFIIKNSFLTTLLESKNKNVPEVWESILKNKGSVQQLDFLSAEEKDVFKTFVEISPKEIIIQAGARQKHIDQGQSLNLIIPPSASTKEINALYILAWELGVKSLYYQLNENAAQETTRNLMTDCVNCSS